MCKKIYINYIIGLAVILLFSLLIAITTKTGIFLLGIMIVFSVFFVLGSTTVSLYYFTIITVFQNIILVVFAPYLNSTETVGIILTKEMVVYIVATVYFVQNRLIGLKKKDLLFICFVVLVATNVLISNSIKIGLAALRQIALIFFCYYYGKSIKSNPENSLKRYFDFILFCCVLVGIFGLFFLSFSDNVWLKIGFDKFWENKSDGQKAYSFVNFYTYDLGIRLKRIVSVFVEPLSCAHFLGIGFVTVFLTHKKSCALKILILVCLVMVLSKSSLVLLLSVIFVLIYSKIKDKTLSKMFVSACVIGGFIILFILTNYSSGLTQNTAIGNHFNAFLYGMKNATLLGKGLGTTGYNASIMGLSDYDSGYNESFFSLCIGQLGLLGTSLIYIFLATCIYDNYTIYKATKNRYVLISVVLLLAVTIESLFSASSISMLGTGLYFVIAGLCSNISDQETYDLQ